MNPSLPIMSAVDASSGHRLNGTLGHPLRCKGESASRASRNAQTPWVAGWQWLAAFRLQRSHDQQRFYKTVFNKGAQGTNCNTAGMLPALSLVTTGAGEPARQAASFQLISMRLYGRFPRLTLAEAAAHGSAEVRCEWMQRG